MFARSWIAALLLVNYLLVLGMGGMSRPEDQHELLLVQTTVEGQHYQQCRYLRMDGLEDFLHEALASRYQRADDTSHHLISVVNGVDAHCSPYFAWPLTPFVHQVLKAPLVSYQPTHSSGIDRTVYPPPRLG